MIQYPASITDNVDLFDDRAKFLLRCINTQGAAFQITVSRFTSGIKMLEGIPKIVELG